MKRRQSMINGNQVEGPNEQLSLVLHRGQTDMASPPYEAPEYVNNCLRPSNESLLCDSVTLLDMARNHTPRRSDDNRLCGHSMNPNLLAHFFNRSPAFGSDATNFRDAEQVLQRQLNFIPPVVKLPGNVEYPRHCGCLCKCITPQRVLDMQTRILKELSKITSDISPGKAAMVSVADVLLVGECFSGAHDEPLSCRFMTI
eukprot:10068891-Karenia_brevis.AAC.1